MEEGAKYPIQQNQSYSDGVFLSKTDQSISIRHFWLSDSDDGYYFLDEKDQVWYPKNEEDLITTVHKDIISLSPYLKHVAFEDMKLEEFYEAVFIGVCHNMIAIDGYKLPVNLVGKITEAYGTGFN